MSDKDGRRTSQKDVRDIEISEKCQKARSRRRTAWSNSKAETYEVERLIGDRQRKLQLTKQKTNPTLDNYGTPVAYVCIHNTYIILHICVYVCVNCILSSISYM